MAVPILPGSGRLWSSIYGRQVGVSDGHSILLRNCRHVRQYHGGTQEDAVVTDIPAARPLLDTPRVYVGYHPWAHVAAPQTVPSP